MTKGYLMLKEKNINRESLKIYFGHAKKYPWHLLGFIISSPLTQVFSNTIPPIIVAGILDDLSNGNFIPGDVSKFIPKIIVYGICIVLGIIGYRFQAFFNWHLEANVIKDINERMFSKISNLDMDYHANSFGGALVSRVNKFAGGYIRIADTIFFNIYALFITLTLTCIVLFPRSPRFVYILMTVVIIYVIASIAISKTIRKLSSKEASNQTGLTGLLADMITNVLTVKSFSAKKLENRRFAVGTKKLKVSTIKLMWATIFRDSAMSFANISILMAALIVAVVSIVNFNAEVGLVFLTLSYATLIERRLWEFQNGGLKNINRGLGDAREGTIMLFTEDMVKDPDKPTKLTNRSEGKIDFNNVGFGHEEESLFSKFDLAIKNGEKIGLIGRSGSGKTTLTKLLLRFKDVKSGSININGTDIRDASQEDLRSMISYVPQEPLLFHRSLRENIAYGKPDATEAEIIEVSKKAHAHDFIVKLPLGYDTLVGERGVKLSGGQKQRVAIARAMIKNAPILILDEATSALDSESEQLIQDSLQDLMKNRTAIVIAHRLSTIQRMDRIVVLEDGRIVEEGSHTTLLKKKGQYAKLWAHQSGGFLTED